MSTNNAKQPKDYDPEMYEIENRAERRLFIVAVVLGVGMLVALWWPWW